MPTAAKLILPAIFAIGLSACTSSGNSNPADTAAAPTKPVPPAPEDDKCNSRLAAQFVGQTYSDALLAQVKAAVGHDTIRVIRPNQPVTMDFREERLNLDLDASDKITRVHCV